MSQPADHAAREAALQLDRHVVAVAPAGSGKTGLLVRRMLRALATVDTPEAVVAVTFTNKAAAEIRHRISAALTDAAGPPPDDAFAAELHADAAAVLARDETLGWNLRNHPGRVQALTIDAFNQWLAARLPVLSGLGGAARIADDPQALYAEAVLAVFDPTAEADLSADDRDAVSTVLGWADNRLDQLLPALVGLLDRRDQWLDHRGALADADGQRDRRILATWIAGRLQRVSRHIDIALTDADVAAIRDSVAHASAHWPQPDAQVPDTVGDLARWPAADAETLDTWRWVAHVLLTREGGWRKRLDKNGGFPTSHRDAKTAASAMLDALAEDAPDLAADLHGIRTLPDPELPGETLALRAALGRVLDLCYAALRVVFAQHGETDFTEVALAAVTAASGEAGTDAIARAEARITHLLVDEMQDTSESQVRLLAELTANWQPGDGRSLFLVGDPQQSIYAFRKAEVRLFQRLLDTRRLGGLDLHVAPLSANFRSAPALIDWFNDQLPALFPMAADTDIGAVPYTPCSSARPDDPTAAVHIVAVPSDEAADEVDAGVRAVQQCLARAGDGERVAVLAATRPQLAPVLDGLRAQGISVQAVDVDPLAARPAAADVAHLIRALMHPHDALAWTALLRAPFVGLHWVDLLALSRGLTNQPWRARLARADEAPLTEDARARVHRFTAALAAIEPRLADLPDAARALWHGLGGPACATAHEAAAAEQVLVCLARHCRGGQIVDGPGWQRALARLFHPPGEGRVDASTIHKSKGLQYDHVVVVGCGRARQSESRPLLHLRALADEVMLVPQPPHADAPGNAHFEALHRMQVAAAEAETARLLYVAVTRSQRSLTIVAGATPRPSDDGVAFRPRARSLAHHLWPILEPAFADLDAAPPGDETPDLPAILPGHPRLPLDWAPPPAAERWRPVQRRTLKPSEQALGEDGAPGADADTDATLIGTLYHEAMARIVTDGLDAWADAGRSRMGSMRAGLRRMGMAEAGVDAAAARVVQLLETTLASADGRWLLGAHPWHACEYHLSGWSDGRWITAIIDRCLVDSDGQLWVIDYKTSAAPVADAAGYREQARAQYARQLAHYAHMLATWRDQPTARSALFLADLGELVRLDL